MYTYFVKILFWDADREKENIGYQIITGITTYKEAMEKIVDIWGDENLIDILQCYPIDCPGIFWTDDDDENGRIYQEVFELAKIY